MSIITCVGGKVRFEVSQHPDKTSVSIQIYDEWGGNVSIIIGTEKADSLYAQLGATLQDMQRQAHPETAQGEAEADENERCTLADASEAACQEAMPPIDVIGVEQTMSPEALRDALRSGK